MTSRVGNIHLIAQREPDLAGRNTSRERLDRCAVAHPSEDEVVHERRATRLELRIDGAQELAWTHPETVQ